MFDFHVSKNLYEVDYAQFVHYVFENVEAPSAIYLYFKHITQGHDHEIKNMKQDGPDLVADFTYKKKKLGAVHFLNVSPKSTHPYLAYLDLSLSAALSVGFPLPRRVLQESKVG